MAKQTPEGRVKAKGREIINKYGAYSFTPVTGGFGVSGLFDEAVVINGIFVGIEYKKDADQLPTALQSANAKRCMDAGGVALLIHKDNLDVLEQTLSMLKMGTVPYVLIETLNSMSVWRAAPIPEIDLT